MQANAAQASVYGLSRITAEEPPRCTPMTRTSDGGGSPHPSTTPRSSRSTRAASLRRGRARPSLRRRPADRREHRRNADGLLRRRRAGSAQRPQTASQRGRLRPDLEHPPLRLVTAPRRGPSGRAPDAGLRRAVRACGGRRLDAGPGRGDPLPAPLPARLRPDLVAGATRGSRTRSPRRPRAVPVHRSGRRRHGRPARRRGSRLDGRGQGRAPRRQLGVSVGESCGYLVVLRSSGLPGRARLSHPAEQSSAPHAGPTLVLEPLRGGPLGDLTVSARVTPARTLGDARRLAGARGPLR